MASEETEIVELEDEQPTGFDPNNAGHVGLREKRAKQRLARINDGFKQMLANPNTRAWLWDLLTKLQPFETTFTAHDQLVLAYNAGRKDVALELLAKLTTPAHIQSYLTMMEESNVT